MTRPDVVVVSNRGPLSFTHDQEGRLVTRKAAGGLVNALGPALAGVDAHWIAAAITDADREASARGEARGAGFRLHLLAVETTPYRAYYDVIANSTLWYVYHGLFDAPRRPRIDRRWREAWDHYRAVNHAFADVVVDNAPDGAVVLVHDYHLSLLGPRLADRRPDLRTVHFNHTPFCTPEGLRMLPDDAAVELMEGLAGHGSCGFHTLRWAKAFEDCGAELLGRVPPTFVAPAPPDVEGIRKVAASEACNRWVDRLDDLAAGRRLVIRVDRIELSKNLLRGFYAFDELLQAYPEWRGQVVFAAFVYPSRETLPDYLAYRAEVETLVAQINARWSTPGWTPIVFDTTDDFSASIAALRRYDVLLVNPVRDGLNLVAKEGALVNERDGVVALSREAGAWDELGAAALGLNPFDVAGTADVLHAALSMPGPERAHRARMLRDAAASRGSQEWMDDLVGSVVPAPPAPAPTG